MTRFRIAVADDHSEIYGQFISLFNKNVFSIYSIPELPRPWEYNENKDR